MKAEDVGLALSVFFSVPLMFLLGAAMFAVWPSLFPYSAKIIPFASKYPSPVFLSTALGSSLLFYFLFEYLEREKIYDPRSPVLLAILLVLVFLAYYVGLAGFYFFRFLDPNILLVTFTFFPYIPYWPALAGLLSAWIFYWVSARFLRRPAEN